MQFLLRIAHTLIEFPVLGSTLLELFVPRASAAHRFIASSRQKSGWRGVRICLPC